jgi:hypothetical protein
MNWQTRLKEEREFYKKMAETQAIKIQFQDRIIALMEKHFNAPPTVMIAAERIADAGAQLATTATNILKEERRWPTSTR